MSAKPHLQHLAAEIAAFVSPPSRRGAPAGSAEGGAKFEKLLFRSFASFALSLGPAIDVFTGEYQKKKFTVINNAVGERAIVFNTRLPFEREPSVKMFDLPPDWLRVAYSVKGLLSESLGDEVYDFAPPTENDSPKYHNRKYLQMVGNRRTVFDFSAVLLEKNTLLNKILFEFKSSKSSNGRSIDGNAHERLSYQTLQYLEIAQLYPKVSFVVVESSAMSKYENKYHPTFNQQAHRLSSVFGNFSMWFLACESDYYRLFQSLGDFVLDGKKPPRRVRDVPLQ